MNDKKICKWCKKEIKENEQKTAKYRGELYHYDCFTDMCYEREAYEWQHE